MWWQSMSHRWKTFWLDHVLFMWQHLTLSEFRHLIIIGRRVCKIGKNIKWNFIAICSCSDKSFWFLSKVLNHFYMQKRRGKWTWSKILIRREWYFRDNIVKTGQTILKMIATAMKTWLQTVISFLWKQNSERNVQKNTQKNACSS